MGVRRPRVGVSVAASRAGHSPARWPPHLTSQWPRRRRFPGHIAVEPSLLWDERWEGTPFRAVIADWSPDWGGLPDQFHFGASSIPRVALESIADRIERGHRHEALAAVHELGSRLRAEGLDLAPWDVLQRPEPPEEASAAARVLNYARSNLNEAPQWIDGQELSHWSERHLRRLIERLAQTLGLATTSYRSLLRLERLVTAATLLGTGRPVGEIAAAVGYGSTRALGLAFRQAGLPSPSDLVRGCL